MDFSKIYAITLRRTDYKDFSQKIRAKVKISGGTIATINSLIGRKIQNSGCLSILTFLQDEIKMY